MVLHFYGLQVLHGSAVKGQRGLHVFCGASQAGKSTLAYALLNRGYEVWADDAVAFTVAGGAISAVGLPFALRIRGDVAAFFEDPEFPTSSSNGKVEALRHSAEERRPEPLRIVTVSLLERGAASIARVPPSEALPQILNHAFYFSLEEEAVRRRMTREFLQLVAEVPLFRVILPRRLDRLDGALDDLEARVLNRL